VSSSSRQPACAGDYHLVSGLCPAGLPLWKKRDGYRWLYSGADGRWYVGGKFSWASRFHCAAGYIFSVKPHEGALPHEIGRTAWAWGDGGSWYEDASIEVSVRPDEENSEAPHWCEGDDGPGAYVIVHDHTAVTAELAVTAPRMVTYLPYGVVVNVLEVVVLTKEQRVRACIEEPFGWVSLVNLEDGYRWAQRRDEEDTSTECDGSSPSTFSVPSSAASFDQARRRTRLRDDASSVALDSPAGPPRLLCVATPYGQLECAGLYALAPRQQMDGLPVWEQSEGGEHYIYSRRGMWCIGGKGARSFACWLFQPNSHEGVLPHEAPSCWRRWDGKRFVDDENILVECAEQPGPLSSGLHMTGPPAMARMPPSKLTAEPAPGRALPACEEETAGGRPRSTRTPPTHAGDRPLAGAWV